LFLAQTTGCPRRGNELRLEPNPFQFLDQPLPAFDQLFLVSVVGRNAGEAEESKKFVEIGIAHPEE
jgi:hypothetical protein